MQELKSCSMVAVTVTECSNTDMACNNKCMLILIVMVKRPTECHMGTVNHKYSTSSNSMPSRCNTNSRLGQTLWCLLMVCNHRHRLMDTDMLSSNTSIDEQFYLYSQKILRPFFDLSDIDSFKSPPNKRDFLNCIKNFVYTSYFFMYLLLSFWLFKTLCL